MEEQTLGLLTKTLRRLTSHYNAIFKPYGINHNQWMALHFIQGQGGIMQRDLANLLEMKESSCTALLEKLESDHLIIRDVSDKDRRQRLLFITDSGEKTLGELDRAVTAIETDMLHDVSPRELKEFCNTSQKILATLDTLG